MLCCYARSDDADKLWKTAWYAYSICKQIMIINCEVFVNCIILPCLFFVFFADLYWRVIQKSSRLFAAYLPLVQEEDLIRPTIRKIDLYTQLQKQLQFLGEFKWFYITNCRTTAFQWSAGIKLIVVYFMVECHDNTLFKWCVCCLLCCPMYMRNTMRRLRRCFVPCLFLSLLALHAPSQFPSLRSLAVEVRCAAQ